MNNKAKVVLASALITGLLAGSAAFADHKPGHKDGKKAHKNKCKGHKNECSGKDGCKGKEGEAATEEKAAE